MCLKARQNVLERTFATCHVCGSLKSYYFGMRHTARLLPLLPYETHSELIATVIA